MIKSPLKEVNQGSLITQEVHLDSEKSEKIKPRAIIFKAHNKDLRKIKELIETQFPRVEIIYVRPVPRQVFFALPNQCLLKRRTLPLNHFILLSNRRRCFSINRIAHFGIARKGSSNTRINNEIISNFSRKRITVSWLFCLP